MVLEFLLGAPEAERGGKIVPSADRPAAIHFFKKYVQNNPPTIHTTSSHINCKVRVLVVRYCGASYSIIALVSVTLMSPFYSDSVRECEVVPVLSSRRDMRSFCRDVETITND